MTLAGVECLEPAAHQQGRAGGDGDGGGAGAGRPGLRAAAAEPGRRVADRTGNPAARSTPGPPAPPDGAAPCRPAGRRRCPPPYGRRWRESLGGARTRWPRRRMSVFGTSGVPPCTARPWGRRANGRPWWAGPCCAGRGSRSGRSRRPPRRRSRGSPPKPLWLQPQNPPPKPGEAQDRGDQRDPSCRWTSGPRRPPGHGSGRPVPGGRPRQGRTAGRRCLRGGSGR